MESILLLKHKYLVYIILFVCLNNNILYSSSLDEINLQILQSEYSKSVFLDNPISFYPFEGNLLDYANENNTIQRGSQNGVSVGVYYSTPDSFTLKQAGTGSKVSVFRGFGERIEFSREISKAFATSSKV